MTIHQSTQPSWVRATRARITTIAVVATLAAACSGPTSGVAGPVGTAPPVVDSGEPVVAPTTPAADRSEPAGPDGQDDGPSPAGTAAPTAPTPTGPSDDEQDPTDEQDQTGSTTVEVYWLGGNADAAVAASRTVATPGVARAAIEELLSGPATNEQAAGLYTAIPADTQLLGLGIDGGVATVDLSREFEAGGGSASVFGRLAQLTYTLAQFSSVDSVRLLLEGEAVATVSGEGVIVEDGLRPADWTNVFPIRSAPTDASAEVWDQSELPVVSIGHPDVWRVVLVAADDTLNVRRTSGTDGAVIGKLVPGVALEVTGATSVVAGDTWRQVRTPAGHGWVHGRYLTRSIAEGQFPSGDPVAVARELRRRLDRGEDITDMVSRTGLWISHHAPLVHVERADVMAAIAYPAPREWGSNALEPGSPENPRRTFREAVVDNYVGAFDADATVVAMQTIEGPNGRPAAQAIPVEFRGLPYVTVHDPGDDEQYGGLDWSQWVVSMTWEDDEIKVIGLTKDQWAP